MGVSHNLSGRISVKFTVIFIIIGSLLLFFSNLGVRDFWAPDEGDFAQIVKELDKDPVVPHLNGTPYGEKPPLFYYAVFACTKIFRFLPNEASMRLASSLAALVTVIALFLATRSALGFRQSFIGVVILGLTPLFYWQARYLQVDMLFSAALVVALLSFFSFIENSKARWYYASFIALGLAFMTKGPLAIALVVPVALLYLVSRKKLSVIATWHTALGVLVFLGIIMPWYLTVYIKEGYPFLYENILRQNFLRFFEAWSHRRPFYYYFTTLPLDFFPWSLFLPLSFYTAFKEWTNNPRMQFFVLWFLWFFFFLSLSSGKISKYMLPVLPALAIIASGTLLEKDRLYNKIAFGITGVLFVILGGTLLFYHAPAYREFLPERIILGILGLISGTAIFLSMRSLKAAQAFACIALFMGLAYITGNVSIFEKWNTYKSPKPVSLRLRGLAGDTMPWVYYGSMRGVYVYYVGRFAVHVEEHDMAGLQRIAGVEQEFYLLTRARDENEVNKAIPGVTVKSRDKIGDTDMVILHYKKGYG